MAPQFDDLTVGDVVAERDVHFSRDSLVRYAGASGDFNPIHYRDDVATSVGLPGVHRARDAHHGRRRAAGRRLGRRPARVVDYQVRFTRPVVVDPADGATVTIVAKVGQLDAEAQVARIDLTVTFNGETVLGKAQVRVSLA